MENAKFFLKNVVFTRYASVNMLKFLLNS